MSLKNHGNKPKGDATRTQRSHKRRAELEAAAKRDGFNSASEAMTAWKKGEYILVPAKEKK